MGRQVPGCGRRAGGARRLPAGVLIDLSRKAQLIVVGTRGAGGFAGLLLGAVSQQLLHHADCPVLIIPTPVEADES